MPMSFTGTAFKLQPGAIEEEAASLGIKAAALHMVLDVESRGRGFLPNGRPIILFEAHVFSRMTKHRYDESRPDISSASWNRELYGAGGNHQFDRLDRACELDREAALQSASWGLGQVMGFNYKMVGFDSVEHFVSAMMESERRQLDAMTEYLRAAGLLRYLMNSPPNYREFARGYNGSGQIAYYAERLREAYEKWVNHIAVMVAVPPPAPLPAPMPVPPPPLVAPKPPKPPKPTRPELPLVARATKPVDWYDSDAYAEKLNAEELDRLDRVGAEVSSGSKPWTSPI
jgi:hypothetical protein